MLLFAFTQCFTFKYSVGGAITAAGCVCKLSTLVTVQSYLRRIHYPAADCILYSICMREVDFGFYNLSFV